MDNDTSRITPDSYLDPLAPVHVTTGAAGNSEMRTKGSPPPHGRCTTPDSPWCVYQSGYGPAPDQMYDFSYSVATIYNATHLKWQQYSSVFEKLIDEFWVVQNKHGAFV